MLLGITTAGSVFLASLDYGSGFQNTPESDSVQSSYTIKLTGYDTRDSNDLLGIGSIDNKVDKKLCAKGCQGFADNIPNSANPGTEFLLLQIRNVSTESVYLKGIQINGVQGLQLGGQKDAESMVKAALKEALIGDFGLSEELIRQRGKELAPNSSAFIVLFEHRWAKKFKDIAIREYGGTVVNQRIISDEDIAMLGSRLQEASKAGDV